MTVSFDTYPTIFPASSIAHGLPSPLCPSARPSKTFVIESPDMIMGPTQRNCHFHFISVIADYFLAISSLRWSSSATRLPLALRHTILTRQHRGAVKLRSRPGKSGVLCTKLRTINSKYGPSQCSRLKARGRYKDRSRGVIIA